MHARAHARMSGVRLCRLHQVHQVETRDFQRVVLHISSSGAVSAENCLPRRRTISVLGGLPRASLRRMFGGSVLVGRELFPLWGRLCRRRLVRDPHRYSGHCAPLFPLASGTQPADRKSTRVRHAVIRDLGHPRAVGHQVAITGHPRLSCIRPWLAVVHSLLVCLRSCHTFRSKLSFPSFQSSTSIRICSDFRACLEAQSRFPKRWLQQRRHLSL